MCCDVSTHNFIQLSWYPRTGTSTKQMGDPKLFIQLHRNGMQCVSVDSMVIS